MTLLPLFAFLCVIGTSESKDKPDDNPQMPCQSVSWEDFIQSISYDAETATSDSWQEYVQGLEQLHANPLDINTATPEDLAQIPFLTASQIEDLQAYIHLDGPMKTLGELALIPSLDIHTRRILPLFLTITHLNATTTPPTSFKTLFTDHRHTIDTRIDIPLYRREGIRTGHYLGDPLYHRLRYNMTSRHVLAGVHMEKDPGERWCDSYGAYLSLRNYGIIRQAILGDYRAGWGEGLVMAARTPFGKSGLTHTPTQGIRPMTGTGETGYMRGAAITLGTDAPKSADTHHVTWQTTLFASYNLLDATLNDDGTVKTIINDGNHRSQDEISKKHNTSATVLGAHARFTFRHLTIGATGYWQHFSRTLSPGNEKYRQWYPRGNNFGNIGLLAAYDRYRWTVSGEIAYSISQNPGGPAMLGRVSYLASRNCRIVLLGRYYSHKYHSFYSGAISEGSQTQNESGIMLHVEATPWPTLTLTSYVDIFADYWPRYQMTHSSHGQDLMLEASWHTSPDPAASRHTLALRYQMKRRETDDTMIPHHRIRLQWTQQPSRRYKFQTTANLHIAANIPQTRKTGYAISENITATLLRNNSTRLTLTAAYFDAPDYQTRIYLYEPAMWNSFSGTTYHGQGLRAIASLRYTHPHGHWMIEARYGITRMLDRDDISTGHDQIPSSTKNDISIQLRYTV